MSQVVTPQNDNTSFSGRMAQHLDSAIMTIAPQWGLKRQRARLAQRVLKLSSSYLAADQSRLMSNWQGTNKSADADLLPELAIQRERSRDLNRNNAVAAGITDTVITNVIGTGIRPQSWIDYENIGITQDAAKALQKQAERIFRRWSKYADAENRCNFLEMQGLIDRQILENGEILILPMMINEPGRPYSTAFQLIEADRLESPYSLRNDSIRYGVEIGRRGQPIAYHVRKTHPNDLSMYRRNSAKEYMRIPAKNGGGRPNILHLYHVKRPGQSRGIPFFSPVMTYFRHLADYMEAELVAARIAACYALIIQTGDPNTVAEGAKYLTDSNGHRQQEMEPGLIGYVDSQTKIETFNPNRPQNNYDAFTVSVLRSICSALGLPYQLVIKDFSKMNYSSARVALLEARRYFKMRQQWLAEKFCQVAWEFVLEEAFLLGEFDVPDFYEHFADYTRCRWITPGWDWVDPVKEVDAALKAVSGGLSSYADEIAARGGDYEQSFEQQASERQLRTEKGLPLLVPENPVPQAQAIGDSQQQDQSQEDTEDAVSE